MNISYAHAARRTGGLVGCVVVTLLVSPANALPQAAPQAGDAPPAAAETDPKWLDRMPKDDRAAIDENIGFAPPAFGEDLRWFETEPANWDRLRGKVIVLQSWSTASTAARGWPIRIAGALKEFQPSDLRIIALHTPENADGAEDFMKRQKPPENVAAVIDPVGAFCDELGIYKRPVNLVIDRNGTIRYAGLNINGLQKAVAELVAEPFDRSKIATPKPKEEAPDSTEASQPQYPPIKGSVGGAADLRGKRAPDFAVDSWFTDQPNAAGKVVVITFWNTDGQHTSAVHSQIKSLSTRFGEQLCCVNISEEFKAKCEENLLKQNLDKSDFNYGVAVDRNKQMQNAAQIAAIPYSIVMSKDWVVRWQGMTTQLKPQFVQQIIDADAAQNQSGGTKPQRGKRRGWTTGS